MYEANIDLVKLPLGTIQLEKIRKSFTILNEINRILLKGEVNASREQQISDHTEHFYQTLAYDFGMKRAVNIDHLRRVRDKVKVMEQIADISMAEKCLVTALVSETDSMLTILVFTGGPQGAAHGSGAEERVADQFEANEPNRGPRCRSL